MPAPSDRLIQETVSRCVSCIVFYVNSGKTVMFKNVMVSEVRTIAKLVAEWGLGGRLDDVLFNPVKEGLIARYGPENGGKLYDEFASAFRTRPMSDSTDSQPSRADRRE